MDVAGKQCRLQWCRNHRFRILRWLSWWIDVGAFLKLAFHNLFTLHKISSFRIKQRVFTMFPLTLHKKTWSIHINPNYSLYIPIPIPPYSLLSLPRWGTSLWDAIEPAWNRPAAPLVQMCRCRRGHRCSHSCALYLDCCPRCASEIQKTNYIKNTSSASGMLLDNLEGHG